MYVDAFTLHNNTSTLLGQSTRAENKKINDTNLPQNKPISNQPKSTKSTQRLKKNAPRRNYEGNTLDPYFRKAVHKTLKPMYVSNLNGKNLLKHT